METIIELDELWPYYRLQQVQQPLHGDRVLAVDEAFIEQHNRIMKEFFDLQAQLSGLYKISKEKE